MSQLSSRRRVVEHLPASTRTWMISDLHLGDGTPSDVFFGKDRHLIALLRKVDREGATLVVNGDAIDFHQAWSLSRVLRAHQEILSEMSRLGREGRLIYVIGNHDYDITLFRDILNFRVCDELHLGDRVLVRHGYEYDPYIGANLHTSQWQTTLHHLLERYLDTWLRLPLGEFYTVPNRVAFWMTHKVAVTSMAFGALLAWLGRPDAREATLVQLNHWAWSNMGDSMGIFRPAMRELREGPWSFIVCGHSHLPGIVRVGERAYANTGSWSFASSQYLIWDGSSFICRDWITGQPFEQELYEPLLDGRIHERSFFDWWRENYMGWLRFREGEERRGNLRRWQRYLRDTQVLSQLRPLPAAEPTPASENE